ncbi:MAG: hypothetical protein KC413_11795, partial [Anaerolineales bacterium]|nr:hypothetical protein [Anaerolineales bacterium]
MKTIKEKNRGDWVALAAWQSQLSKAQDEPWLARLMLQQGERILRRFVYFYNRLRDLPRKTRRIVQKRLITTLAGAALLLALSGTPSVHAATITVDGITCILADAITAANTDTATNGCIAGDAGSDTIDLQTDVTLTSALPIISSNIILQGNNHTINGNNSYRVLELNSAGNLTLNNATITGGSATGPGGGIYNYSGVVTINNSTINNNYASTYGGGIRNDFGLVTINNSTISGNTSGGSGGGIDSDNYTLTINNSTITGNSAGTYGGGIANGGGDTTLNRTIVSGNTAVSGNNEILQFGGNIYANNFNLFGENSESDTEAFSGAGTFTPGLTDITATNNGTNSAALGSILNIALANNSPNGDPNIPDYPDTHALVSGSPAIDAAPSAA